MRKVERNHTRCLLVLTLILCMGSLVYAQSDDLMLSLSIQQADERTLQEMARLRNLPDAEPELLRGQLLAYHGLEVSPILLEEEADRQYEMTILHADKLSTDSASSLVTLSGNVVVSFSLEGESTEKKLSAQKMLIDLEHTMLSAQGSVSYEDPYIESALQSIDGSIITLDWSNSTLFIRGATTQSEKTNSEDQTINLYTSGQQITYKGSASTLIYSDGWIGTTKEDPLSSIKAKQLLFLPGGDLMVKQAFLQLGRVPVFWTPFFLFPGNRMAGNPAMGFSSERGMFVSLSYEVFGTNPKLVQANKSSFASLLSATNDQTLHPGSILYTTREIESTFQAWARQSGSYLTLLTDAYELSGLHAGFTARISLLDKRLVVDSHGSVAVYGEGKETLLAYADVPVVRYYGEHSIKLDTTYADISLVVPYYSDPKVKRLYANRLTMFSFDAPLGKTQEFPTDFNSDVTSFTIKLAGSFTLPKTLLFPVVKSLTVSDLGALAKWDWQRQDNEYRYVLKQVVIPQLQMNLAGDVISYSTPVQAKTTKTLEQAELELPALLSPAYKTVTASNQKSPVAATRDFTFSYSIDQKVTHSFTDTTNALDWDDDAYLYSFTKASLTVSASPNSNVFKVSQEFIPQFSVVEDQSKQVFYNQEAQLFSVTKAQSPLLGLTYTLSQRLYRFQQTHTKSTASPPVVIDNKLEEYAFTKETVTIHQIKFERAVQISAATLTPSLTASLYPLTQSLLPKIMYAQGPVSLSASYRWSELGGTLKKDVMSAQLRIAPQQFAFQVDASYDFKKASTRFQDGLTLSQSMTASLFSKSVKLTQQATYVGLSTKSIQDWIDQLTFKAEVPSLTVAYGMQGRMDALEPQTLMIAANIKQLSFRMWKRRIELRMGLDTSFNFFFQDRYASNFDIVGSIGFSIAEFLDCNLSIKSSNTGFFRYYDDQGAFSFPLLWADLLRSFDLVGDGRYHTQFNLRSITFDLVHYLGDWSLNCKYTGSVVLSNKQYSWVPTVSVFLTWNTLPELNVEEKWTQSNQEWIRTQAT